MGRRGEMVRDAFAKPNEILREYAEGCRARQQAYVGLHREPISLYARPFLRRYAVDRRAGVGQQRIAQPRLLLA